MEQSQWRFAATRVLGHRLLFSLLLFYTVSQPIRCTICLIAHYEYWCSGLHVILRRLMETLRRKLLRLMV
jgi:hypothetical protein